VNNVTNFLRKLGCSGLDKELHYKIQVYTARDKITLLPHASREREKKRGRDEIYKIERI
jgi:hypothetical protein